VLFFLGPDGLVEVERAVTGAATPAGALRALLAGPQPSERSEGTSSALVSSTAARLEGTRGGVARVSLDSGFQDGEIGDEPAALAEIVYTLTAFPHIERVTFLVEGEIVAVPRPDGSLISRPVGREDYAQLLTDVQP
jgi:spore germination protein GerM